MKQTTKDTIAFWLLILFILSPFAKVFYTLIDAFNLHYPLTTILWYAGLVLLVGVSGLFLLSHFVIMMHDLRHYKSTLEKEN